MPFSEQNNSVVWSARWQAVGVALWTSFLVASLETMIVFAMFDPASLEFERTMAGVKEVRLFVYAFGFFFLWLATFLGTALTAFMLESSTLARLRQAGQRSS